MKLPHLSIARPLLPAIARLLNAGNPGNVIGDQETLKDRDLSTSPAPEGLKSTVDVN